ncbi:unnamed protein product [Rodentolepis nana]|uniref:Uncharacterized protein n=1 Tax=Rodentolepis nana TaxID=102285 RepID=A0A0R3TX19_RODNA|nr:unnamed protein product [Rodentolepis nana]
MEGKNTELNRNTSQITNGDIPGQSQRTNSDSVMANLTSDPFREYQNVRLNPENVEEFWKQASTIISERVKWVLGHLLEPSQQPTRPSQSHSLEHAANARLPNVQTCSGPSTPLLGSLTVQQYIDEFNKEALGQRSNESDISSQRTENWKRHVDYLIEMAERSLVDIRNIYGRNLTGSKHRRIDGMAERRFDISRLDNMEVPSVPLFSDMPLAKAMEEHLSSQSSAHTSDSSDEELDDIKIVEIVGGEE